MGVGLVIVVGDCGTTGEFTFFALYWPACTGVFCDEDGGENKGETGAMGELGVVDPDPEAEEEGVFCCCPEPAGVLLVPEPVEDDEDEAAEAEAEEEGAEIGGDGDEGGAPPEEPPGPEEPAWTGEDCT